MRRPPINPSTYTSRVGAPSEGRHSLGGGGGGYNLTEQYSHDASESTASSGDRLYSECGSSYSNEIRRHSIGGDPPTTPQTHPWKHCNSYGDDST